MKRRLLLVGGAAMAIVVTLLIRTLVEGNRALEAGDAAQADGRIPDAIAGWEAAARWYGPGLSHVDEAYARLTGLAAAKPEYALAAWSAIRSAALATGGLWQPHADDLAAANEQIALLSARDPAGAEAAGAAPSDRLAYYREQLARPPRPTGPPVALFVLGVLAWLGGIGWVIRRGIDDAGKVIRRPALVGAVTTTLGIAAWAAALSIA